MTESDPIWLNTVWLITDQ